MAEFDKLLKKLEKDIENKEKIALLKTAKEINKDMEMQYRKVIKEFEAEYKPKKYKRTDGTNEASNKSFGKMEIIDINEFDGSYLGGIELSGKNITPGTYRAKDQEWVFERTFVKGWHGFPMKRSSWYDTLVKRHPENEEEYRMRYPMGYKDVDALRKEVSRKRAAGEKVKSKETLPGMTYNKIKKSTGTPKEKMDEYFADYVSSGKIDELFDKFFK